MNILYKNLSLYIKYMEILHMDDIDAQFISNFKNNFEFKKNILIHSKSLSNLDIQIKKLKYINSDTFLNKLKFYPCDKKKNILKLSQSFVLDINFASISSNEYNETKNIKKDENDILDIIDEKCKICNNNINIIKNIYHNKYCSYSCYKISRLKKNGFYYIKCANCLKKFKTLNKFTDYCSDECFNNIYKKNHI
jgi:endogenous inhibitor of DNA gyrase (YacG/DUF329 family)